MSFSFLFSKAFLFFFFFFFIFFCGRNVLSRRVLWSGFGLFFVPPPDLSKVFLPHGRQLYTLLELFQDLPLQQFLISFWSRCNTSADAAIPEPPTWVARTSFPLFRFCTTRLFLTRSALVAVSLRSTRPCCFFLLPERDWTRHRALLTPSVFFEINSPRSPHSRFFPLFPAEEDEFSSPPPPTLTVYPDIGGPS